MVKVVLQSNFVSFKPTKVGMMVFTYNLWVCSSSRS